MNATSSPARRGAARCTRLSLHKLSQRLRVTAERTTVGSTSRKAPPWLCGFVRGKIPPAARNSEPHYRALERNFSVRLEFDSPSWAHKLLKEDEEWRDLLRGC